MPAVPVLPTSTMVMAIAGAAASNTSKPLKTLAGR
jgi:hypothetical protein